MLLRRGSAVLVQDLLHVLYTFHTPVRRMVVNHPELLPATYVQMLLPCYDEICDDSRDPL